MVKRDVIAENPNFYYPNNESADLIAENVDSVEAVDLGAPASTRYTVKNHGTKTSVSRQLYPFSIIAK
jgi:hypothetical protein